MQESPARRSRPLQELAQLLAGKYRNYRRRTLQKPPVLPFAPAGSMSQPIVRLYYLCSLRSPFPLMCHCSTSHQLTGRGDLYSRVSSSGCARAARSHSSRPINGVKLEILRHPGVAELAPEPALLPSPEGRPQGQANSVVTVDKGESGLYPLGKGEGAHFVGAPHGRGQRQVRVVDPNQQLFLVLEGEHGNRRPELLLTHQSGVIA